MWRNIGRHLICNINQLNYNAMNTDDLRLFEEIIEQHIDEFILSYNSREGFVRQMLELMRNAHDMGYKKGKDE